MHARVEKLRSLTRGLMLGQFGDNSRRDEALKEIADVLDDVLTRLDRLDPPRASRGGR